MEFKNLLERVLGRHDGVPQLKINSLTEFPCSQPGLNFMSVVRLVHVEGELANGAPYSKSVFVKRPILPAGYEPSFSIDDAFTNEALMYQRVLPLIMTAADVTRLPFPHHYHAASDVIVLQDLEAEGYGLGDAAEGFDLATARCVVKTLARYHAASIHTNVVKKDRFSEEIRNLKPLGLFLSCNRTVMDSSLRRTIRYMETEADLALATTFLKSLQGRVTEKLRELREAKHVAVLVHGDFWFNNILTRRKERCEVSEENLIRIIDFQTCTYQSPAVDFWLFLYTSIAPTLLSDSCDGFVQLYSSTVLDILRHQNTPAEHVPSLTALTEELRSRELYGFLAAMAYLPALYLRRESIVEMENASEEENKGEGFIEKFMGPEIRQRIVDVARYCGRKGVL